MERNRELTVQFQRLQSVSALRALWMQRSDFANALRTAVTANLRGKAANREVQTFLDNVVVRLLAKPDDLLLLCSMLNEERAAREFMRFVVRHSLVDSDLLHAIVTSPEIFHALPDDPEWKEVVILVYGRDLLNAEPGRKRSIAEIVPLGVDIERPVVRSLVGSAFDAGELCDEDVARLLELFPGDAYFREKLGEKP